MDKFKKTTFRLFIFIIVIYFLMKIFSIYPSLSLAIKDSDKNSNLFPSKIVETIDLDEEVLVISKIDNYYSQTRYKKLPLGLYSIGNRVDNIFQNSNEPYDYFINDRVFLILLKEDISKLEVLLKTGKSYSKDNLRQGVVYFPLEDGDLDKLYRLRIYKFDDSLIKELKI